MKALIAALLVTFLTISGVAAERGGHTPFTICHKTGNGYILLTTPDLASYEAHIAHGDVPPGEDGTCPAAVEPEPTSEPTAIATIEPTTETPTPTPDQTPSPTNEPTIEVTSVPTQPVATDVPVTEVPTDEPATTTPVPTATDGPRLPPPPVPTTPGSSGDAPGGRGPEVVAPENAGSVQPGVDAVTEAVGGENVSRVDTLPSAGSGPMASYAVPAAFAVIGVTLAASAIGIRRKV